MEYFSKSPYFQKICIIVIFKEKFSAAPLRWRDMFFVCFDRNENFVQDHEGKNPFVYLLRQEKWLIYQIVSEGLLSTNAGASQQQTSSRRNERRT